MTTVYAGAQSPESLAVTITSGSNNVDLGNVAQVTLLVRDLTNPSSPQVEWDTSISGLTAQRLVATHVFGASDVPKATTLRIMPRITFRDYGVRRCVPFNLQVLE